MGFIGFWHVEYDNCKRFCYQVDHRYAGKYALVQYCSGLQLTDAYGYIQAMWLLSRCHALFADWTCLQIWRSYSRNYYAEWGKCAISYLIQIVMIEMMWTLVIKLTTYFVPILITCSWYMCMFCLVTTWIGRHIHWWHRIAITFQTCVHPRC